MNHINHIERTSQALGDLIAKHLLSLKSFEHLSDDVKEQELREYCSSAVMLRQTLIEDLKSEISAVDNRSEKDKFQMNKELLAASKKNNPLKESRGKGVISMIRKTEKSIVQAYMQVLRNNTFSNMTESILRGHLETLRNRLQNIKNYHPNRALAA